MRIVLYARLIWLKVFVRGWIHLAYVCTVTRITLGYTLRLAWLHLSNPYRRWRIDRHFRRLENAPRQWVAHSPHGAVILGSSITYAEALKRASALGDVSFTDTEHGFIFYNTSQQEPPAAGVH